MREQTFPVLLNTVGQFREGVTNRERRFRRCGSKIFGRSSCNLADAGLNSGLNRFAGCCLPDLRHRLGRASQNPWCALMALETAPGARVAATRPVARPAAVQRAGSLGRRQRRTQHEGMGDWAVGRRRIRGRRYESWTLCSTVGNGQSPEMQLRELREYCERRGWRVAGEYVDSGFSGARDSRPELNRLMADAHKRKFDIVCVWKFDRFACSVSHLLRVKHSRPSELSFVPFPNRWTQALKTIRQLFIVVANGT